MKRILAILIVLILLLLIVGWLDPASRLSGIIAGERFFQGKPTRYWSEQLRSEDPTVSEGARQRLDEAGAASVPVLVELLQDKSAEEWDAAKVRWLAAEMLGHIGVDAQQATPAVLTALTDMDAHVRSVAARSLPAINAPAEMAVPALVDLIQRDPSVTALRALSEYGPSAEPALTDLVRLVRDEQLNSEIRWNAVRTLGKMRDAATEAIPAIVEQLQNPVPSIREHAAEALGDIGPAAQQTAEALLPLLTDTVPKVRRDAARSLGQIRASANVAGPPLQRLLEDPESIVRDAARTALTTVAPELLTPEAMDVPSSEPSTARDDVLPPSI
jgi:HEAT repeat protein